MPTYQVVQPSFIHGRLYTARELEAAGDAGNKILVQYDHDPGPNLLPTCPEGEARAKAYQERVEREKAPPPPPATRADVEGLLRGLVEALAQPAAKPEPVDPGETGPKGGVKVAGKDA